jgi:hypothetical protein
LADQKISELTALTGANVADDDAIAIVDTSATETKKIVFSELKNALDTATGFVRITGDTMTGNLSMGDNVKAIFGAGSDLQIYHDGSNSIITDLGTGKIEIQSNGTGISLQKGATENLATFLIDGAVNLYYDNALKLATTSTGVDITGTLTSDGLTVGDNSTSEIPIYFNSSSTDFSIGANGNNFILAQSTGDLDSNQLLTVTSTGLVGIGTSSPSYQLDVQGQNAGTDCILRVKTLGTQSYSDAFLYLETAGSGISGIAFGDAADNNVGLINYDHGDDSLYIRTNATEAMRIDSSGNVGIGTSSPVAPLHVIGNDGVQFNRSGQTNGFLIRPNASTDGIRFTQGGTGDRMTIDASGNVGIGTSSPQGDGLHIQGSDNNNDDDLISLGFTFDANSKVLGTIGVHNSASDTGGLKFSTKNAGTLAERMRITSGGTLQIAGGGNDNVGEINMGNTAQNANRFQVRHQSSAWYLKTVDSEPLVFGTSNTERMRIDSSGNVGIGTTGAPNKLVVKRDSTTAATNAQIVSENRTGATGQYALYATSLDNGSGSGFKPVAFGAVQTAASGRTADFIVAVSDTDNVDLSTDERMRIDSSGNLLVGTTSITGEGGLIVQPELDDGACRLIFDRASTTASSLVLEFENADVRVGGISYTNTTTSFETTSDYRLKENVVNLTGATTRLKQLEPKRFNFIADADTTVDGFIAHEVQSVVPEAITGTHNEVDADGNPVYQGIDQSKLVPLLVATIKELEARITALENA